MKLARARRPFRFFTRLCLTSLTGLRARSLSELLAHLEADANVAREVAPEGPGLNPGHNDTKGGMPVEANVVDDEMDLAGRG